MSLWGKPRKQEPPPLPQNVPKSATVAPNSVDVKKEATTSWSTSNMPVGRAEPDTPGGLSTIGRAVRIVGQVFGKEDLFVDGDVEGKIELVEHRLTVGLNGKVQAGIRAREVIVLGAIQGNVEASERLEIGKEAKVVGDIKTARIIIEDGANFEGSIDIMKPEPAKVVATANRPQTLPSAAGVTPAAVPTPAEVKG